MEGGKLTPTQYHENPISYYKEKKTIFRLRDKQVGHHNPEKYGGFIPRGEGRTGAPWKNHLLLHPKTSSLPLKMEWLRLVQMKFPFEGLKLAAKGLPIFRE